MNAQTPLPILRVYTCIDDIQQHLDDVGQDFGCFESGLNFVEDMYQTTIVPAEREVVDFITAREISLSQLYTPGFVETHIASVDYKTAFPESFEAQRRLMKLAKRLGIRWAYRQIVESDFYTLCHLASEYGDVAAEMLHEMWKKRRWKNHFERNADYVITLPIFRAIESLRERMTMEEWGKRRKLFFGESCEEMEKEELEDGFFDDEEDEDNNQPWLS